MSEPKGRLHEARRTVAHWNYLFEKPAHENERNEIVARRDSSTDSVFLGEV